MNACTSPSRKRPTKPASFNFLKQQERFEHFIEVCNNERPHQALAVAYPGELYTSSPRVYEPPLESDYPFHTVFAGHLLGIREVDDPIWLVSFMDDDLGVFDQETDRVEPGPNPFIPEKL